MDYYIKTGRLNLSETLFCGQCFRFTGENGIYSGFSGNRFVTLEQREDGVLLKNVSENDISYWKNYFDVPLDYDEVFRELSSDDTFVLASEGHGIRILRQEPFETLISFIISQNNNIKRITGIISRLCESFGEKIPNGYAFPTPERLAELAEEDLAPLRAGFRAKYILDASRKVAGGEVNLGEIAALSSDEGREKLKVIVGVGDKVADCVLLFGMHKLDCIPKDVWVKRIIAAYYPGGFPECMKRYGGIAQQYLFDYARKNGV